MTAPVIPARPTTYKGTRMRSRTEARFAEIMDTGRIPWRYEPRCFADETGQYLPDFELLDVCVAPGDASPRPCYVDVKPPRVDLRELAPRMQRIWSSEPSAALLVLTETTRAFGQFDALCLVAEVPAWRLACIGRTPCCRLTLVYVGPGSLEAPCPVCAP